ncbi:MAG: biopolymer transporter ExbD [Myxococcaceae bacterium]
MAMGVGPNRGVKSDINVTPLVDVVLVLLIIFMVITPMLQRGKDVKLPKAVKVENERKGAADPLILSITADRRTFIERDEVKIDDLETSLRAKLTAEPGKRILIKGDGSLTVEDVRKVMDNARKAGAKGISLGVEQEKQ